MVRTIRFFFAFFFAIARDRGALQRNRERMPSRFSLAAKIRKRPSLTARFTRRVSV